MSVKKSRAFKTVRESQVTLNHLVTPNDLNFSGFVFGGVILKLIDHAAYVCAHKHAGGNCITASFDRVDFKEPIYVGELVTMHASVNFVGHTSMEIGVKVTAENLKTNKIRHTNTSYVTMVAVDTHGKPKEVPGITPETKDEKRRYKEGEKRYKERKRRSTR